MDIVKRFFKRDGCKITQDPPKVKLFECSSDCEIVNGKLSLFSELFYLGIIDSGQDRFKLSLEIKRPTRWQNGDPETITITREFLHFSEIKKWVLSLETIILGAIFSKERCDNKATEAWENHVVMRMLLELTRDFSKLKSVIDKDKEKRQDILDSRQEGKS